MERRPSKPVKSREVRVAEAVAIRRQLADMAFPAQDIQDMAAALSEFVSAGQGVTRTFKLRHLGVDVLLQLSMQPHITSFARVRKTSMNPAPNPLAR